MRNKLTIRNFILVIMLLYFTSIYSKNEYVLCPNSIDSEVRNYQEELIHKLFEDYHSLYKSIGCNTLDSLPLLASKAFYYKINLNKFKELKNIGLDIVEFSKNNFVSSNIFESWVKSHLFFTGRIISKAYVPEPSSPYHEYYNIQVNEIFKGTDLFKSNIEQIKVFQRTGIYVLKLNKKVRVDTIKNMSSEFDFGEIGKEYVFFTNFSSEDYESKYQNGQWIPKGKGKHFVDENEFIEIETEDPVDFNDRTNLRNARYIEYDNEEILELRKFIIEYEKINDTPNFYKRSYK